jgi:hypothetical protein
MAPAGAAQQQDQGDALHDQANASPSGLHAGQEDGEAEGADRSTHQRPGTSAAERGAQQQLTRHQEVMMQLEHEDYAYLK